MPRIAIALTAITLLAETISFSSLAHAWSSHHAPTTLLLTSRYRPRQRRQQQQQQRTTAGVVLNLNRFLFDEAEVDYSEAVPTVTLPKEDYRTIHAANILALRNGDTVRSGIVSAQERGGLVTDDASVEWLPEGKVKKAEPLGNGKPPGSLRIFLHSLKEPDPNPATTHQSVALILALPRPLQLGRMLPMIAQMGVDTLVLTEARKVPKDYFGSHLFRKPELLTELLIEGLCQAGDVQLPKIHITRNLSRFLSEELAEMFPSHEWSRVIAHPQRAGEPAPPRIRNVPFPPDCSKRRMVIAVGPEGGWEEPNELDRFHTAGFQQITMGPRILRSDCAVVSLLSLAHDACFTD